MLPKKEKFTTQDFKDFKKEKSRKIHTSYGFFLVLRSFPELRSLGVGGSVEGVDSNKKGIILSKKNFKTAVQRNKVKRLFYNTILEIKNKLKESSSELESVSFIFYPNKVFTKEDLKDDLMKILTKVVL